MKYLKKLFAPAKKATAGEMPSAGDGDVWLFVMVILLVIALLAGLYVMIRKHRKSKEDQPEPETAPLPPTKKEPVSRLRKVWKQFIRQIPWGLRQAIMVFQHFIVFGEAGTGKSALIDRHTDWQGHARQFYASYTANPLLQIYLGSKVLIQEIPSDLLNDTTQNARKALHKIWRPLFKRKAPTTVVVINTANLTDDPERLKKEAQVVRGKINLLARIRRKPVEVRIALTHMDQVEGFSQFAHFLHENKIPLDIVFSSREDVAAVEECLTLYEEHLISALVTLPADQYLKGITFIRKAPGILRRLSKFIQVLNAPDPLSLKPRITSLHLSSHTAANPEGASPFATSLTAKDLKKFNPLFRHRIIAIALGALGIIFLTTVFCYEHYLIRDRYQEMAAIEASPPSRYDERMHNLFVDPITRMQQHILMAVLPDFFPHINSELDRRCIENIQKFYLIPELNRFTQDPSETALTQDTLPESENNLALGNKDTADAQDKVIYLLGLLYATRTNDLGKLIGGHIDEWAGNLGLPRKLIEDYINNNNASWPVALNIETISYQPAVRASVDPQPWMVYFSTLNKAFHKTVITKSEFNKIQRQADTFLQTINQLERYDLAVKAADLLEAHSAIGLDFELIAREEDQIRQDTLREFLESIKATDLNPPKVTDDLCLADFLKHLKVMLDLQEAGEMESRLYHFLFGGQEYKFSSRDWKDVLYRSKMTFFVRDFIHHNRYHDGLLFFTSTDEFEDLSLDAFSGGQFLFTGSTNVDGRFTMDAFEQQIKPVLTELPEFMSTLPIPKTDRKKFSDFLYKEVEAYGARYADAYRNYYVTFDIKAHSLVALRYVLNQLVLPSSRLIDVFLAVRDNTFIDPGDNEYLRIFSRKLSEFDFFQRLMEEKKGAYPELDNYRALVQQLQMDIEQSAAPVEAAEEDPFSLFKDNLTPLGRVSFSFYQNEPDSYLNLVNTWLENVGIPAPWQDVFIAPFYEAYYLGLSEVETDIATIWESLLQTDVIPLRGKFPFNAASDNSVTLAALKNAAHPNGHFFQTFNRLLSPICVDTDGIWRQRIGAFDAPKLPSNMLDTVNALSNLSATLWDKNGEELPLEFRIRPLPLPKAQQYEPIAVLAYLHTGDASIFAFNQQPSWKVFSYDWKTESIASVGIEFTDESKSEKFSTVISVPKCEWSFYHLLRKTELYSLTDKYYDSSEDADSAWRFSNATSQRTDDEPYQTLVWHVETPAYEQSVDKNDTPPVEVDSVQKAKNRVLNLKFEIQGDPWSLFQMPW